MQLQVERSEDAHPAPPSSMSLLHDLMAHTLDAGYGDAAARRRREPTPQRRHRALLPGIALVLVGLLLATAAAQVRSRAPAAARARAALAAEVERRTSAADQLSRRLDALRVEVVRSRARRLASTRSGSLTAARLVELEAIGGTAAVVGPGLRVTVDDAAGSRAGAPGVGDPRADDQPVDGRVLDRDLQIVVNGLWSAGAEAVAVNGQRLTALSAIRSAGSAVLVNYRRLRPPYVLTVVGDPQRLEANFRDGPGGQYLQVLADNYGVQVDVSPERSLVLPAAAGVRLRHSAVQGQARAL